MSHDVIVIGAGANGLVAAHLLAKAGRQVLVLEQRDAEEERLETGAVLPQVEQDLGLAGVLVTERPDPWLTAPNGEGGLLELWQDPERTADSLSLISEADARAWPRFAGRMHALAGVLADLAALPAPDIATRNPAELFALGKLGLRVRGLGRETIIDLLRVMPMPVADLLDEWFESDVLKAALAAGGVMHLCQGPRSGGTSFVMLHHHVGSPPGVFRPPLTDLRLRLLSRPGVEIRRGARVARISVRAGRARSVVLDGGEELPARAIVSNADPRATLLSLLEPGWLPPETSLAVRNIRCRGVAALVTLHLTGEAPFRDAFIGPSIEFLERAYDDAKHGRISAAPWIEARAWDHRIEAHVQYVPAKPEEGWNEEARRRLGKLVVEGLSRRAPGLAGMVRAAEVWAPADFERQFGLTEGQAYHAELGLDQILFMRPVAGWSRHRTPIVGLYLCGAGTHPGGALAGASGRLAARAILEDES